MKIFLMICILSLGGLNAYDPFSILVPKKKIVKHSKKIKKKIIRKKIYLNLNSILDRYAKINRIWYKAGDRVHNYRIKEIFEDSVILTRRGKIKVLNIYKARNKFIK